jgi:hypothetical protein
VQTLEVPDDVRPDSGRHRATTTNGRTRAVRLALLAGVLLATAGLGVGAASALGLTDFALPAGPGAVSGASDVLPTDIGFESTVDIHPAMPRTPERAPASPAPEPVAEPSPGPQTPAPVAEKPQVEARQAPVRAAPTVRLGERCRVRGARAVTADGAPAVCRSGHGHGGTRWRSA